MFSHRNETKKLKNITHSSLMGDKVGRIHMKKQNLDKMNVRRVSALRNRKRAAEEDGNSSLKKSKK